MSRFFLTSLACTREGCAMKYFSRLCNTSPHTTVLCLSLSQGWHWNCGVWWAGSPQLTEVLNLCVFVPLKLPSIRAEIWSVKNCCFPPSSCIPEGNSGRWPSPIEGRNLAGDGGAEAAGAACAGSACSCQGIVLLAGHGQRSSSTISSALLTCFCASFVFLSVIQSQVMGSQPLGEKELTLLALH